MASEPSSRQMPPKRALMAGLAILTPAALGAVHLASVSSAVVAETAPGRALPGAPANGVMSFVVESFTPPVVFEKNACPNGPVLRLREAYLTTLPEAEAARLRRPENLKEWDTRWQAYAFNESGANICTNPDMFDHGTQHTVQSPIAWGLDLDGGDKSGTCAHEEFKTPTGQTGIDNQEYRAQGCTLEWRGVDGVSSDQEVGMRQFHLSGEWTQVIVLKGVDSLVNDPDVQVIYANTRIGPSWIRRANGCGAPASPSATRHRASATSCTAASWAACSRPTLPTSSSFRPGAKARRATCVARAASSTIARRACS